MPDEPSSARETFAARMERLGVPVAVTLQVTGRCHLCCLHCFQSHDPVDELTGDEVTRILLELRQAGTLFLTITGGEPFLRADLDAILARARQERFAVRLLTTGHFIDDAWARRLAELAVEQVELSLYGPDAASHERITRVEGSFARVIGAAVRLRRERIGVVLKSPLLVTNAARQSEWRRLAGGLGCRHTIDPTLTTRDDGGRAPLAHRAAMAQLIDFYATETDDAVAEPPIAYHPTERRDETPCRVGRLGCFIGPSGLVQACVALPEPVGDLRRQSFRDIWQRAPELERLRSLKWDDIVPCRDCSWRPYCRRCYGPALLEDGDLLGPSREACRHAVAWRHGLERRGRLAAGTEPWPAPLLGDAQTAPAAQPCPLIGGGCPCGAGTR